MHDVLFWTGVCTWVICSVVGLFAIIDKLAEWLVDSVRFKAYVARYLAAKANK